MNFLIALSTLPGMNGNSPDQTQPASAATSFPIREVGKGTREWTLTLQPPHLELLENGSDRPYIVLREDMMRSATLIEGIRVLALDKPRKVSFQLTNEAVAALSDWIGKPVLAAFYLKRRYAWVLPVAVIWIFGSLPVSGNPERGIQPLPFDAISFSLGIVLVISWAFAKWKPHPVLFLVDSLWFVAMGANLVYDVMGGRSKAWLVLVLLLGWLVYSGIRHFIRFRETRITPDRRK